MRLEDSVANEMNFNDDFDFHSWNLNDVVVIMWGGNFYQAYILEFGGMQINFHNKLYYFEVNLEKSFKYIT